MSVATHSRLYAQGSLDQTAARVCEGVSSGTCRQLCSAHSLVSVRWPLNHAQLLQRTLGCSFWEVTMDDVVNSRVRTEVISWKRRELAAPDSRAPLLLSLMACSSPASKLMRMTLKALRGQPPQCGRKPSLAIRSLVGDTCQNVQMRCS